MCRFVDWKCRLSIRLHRSLARISFEVNGPFSLEASTNFPGWTLLDQSCAVCFTPLVRSPSPDHQLLCVRCGRDTTSAPPNGIHLSPTTSAAEESNRPPATYHPFINGDDMDSEEDELEAGRVMEVELRGDTNPDCITH